MIRALDIHPGERWTPNRIPIHMALATLRATEPDTALPKRKRRFRLWHYAAISWLLPSAVALSVVAALYILRRGLL